MPTRSAEDWRLLFVSQVRLPSARWCTLFLDLIDDLATAERAAVAAQQGSDLLAAALRAAEAHVFDTSEGRSHDEYIV